MEWLTYTCWAEPSRYAALRIAIELNLFKALNGDSGKIAPKEGAKATTQNDELEIHPSHLNQWSTDNLAQTTGASPTLISRLMKHLAAMQIVVEKGPGLWGPTPLTVWLATPQARDTISYCFDVPNTVFAKLPAFLAEGQYRDVVPPTACPSPPGSGRTRSGSVDATAPTPTTGPSPPPVSETEEREEPSSLDAASSPSSTSTVAPGRPCIPQTAFQYAFNTDLDSWTWGRARPNLAKAFIGYVAAYHADQPRWTDEDFYPVEDRLLQTQKHNEDPDPQTWGSRTGNTDDDIEENSDKDSVFLVDVGGGRGDDIMSFARKYGDAIRGRLVLQDKDASIAAFEAARSASVAEENSKEQPKANEQPRDPSPSSALSRIEGQIHDFFLLQPIKHAETYYLHSVLHDWPNDACVQILENIVGAMRPGHSRVLINEVVMPDTGAGWRATGLDWCMMALVGARERSEGEWRALLARAGLRVVGVWYCGGGGAEGVIEAVLDGEGGERGERGGREGGEKEKRGGREGGERGERKERKGGERGEKGEREGGKRGERGGMRRGGMEGEGDIGECIADGKEVVRC